MRSVQHNTASRLVAHAEGRGAQLALADEERRLDYRALDGRIARCAALLAEMGVARGDRVALVLGNRSAYLETVLAAARLAAIATPLNARLTAPELRGLLADAAPRVLVHDEGDAARMESACCELAAPPQRIACGGSASEYERALAQAAPRDAIEPVSPDDPMLLMYTSGTTGRPKGALLPHRKTLYNSLNAEGFFSLTSADRVLVILPLFHSFGLKILALPALHAGASIFLHAHFDPARTWRTVAAERISFFGAVPTQLAELRDALEKPGAGPVDVSSLRFVFGAGAAVPVDLIRAFERHGLVLQQGFGQTETSILCCLDARDAVRKAGSVGRPVTHAEVRVVTLASLDAEPAAWRETAVGETGEIVVRGPITMLGYWNDPEATAQTLRGDWLRTGDLATRDEEGFLTLVGRARHMYISGGENVYPAEIERVYAEHPAVREIAVVGVPDPKWGEVGCAYVVPAEGARVEPEALREWGSQRLARFKLPKRFLEVAELPRTETGKVQKHRLARQPWIADTPDGTRASRVDLGCRFAAAPCGWARPPRAKRRQHEKSIEFRDPGRLEWRRLPRREAKRAASARAPEEIPLARVPSLPTSPPDPRRLRRIERTQRRYVYRTDKENLLHPIATAASYPFFAEWYTPAYIGRIAPRWVWAMGRRGLELTRFACQWASFRFDKMRAYEQLLSRSLPFFPEDAGSDDAFAWWRIAGANPLSLAQERSLESLSRRIPLDLQRCEAQLARKLGRRVSLAQEAQRGRLFSVDFRRIQQSLRPDRDDCLPDRQRDSRWRAKYLPAPIGVFVEEPGRRVGLVPVAIQIDQPLNRPELNPVYTPDDDWGWRIAKLYFEVADVSFQLSCGHLRRTHFLIEPFALATPRQLAREHPIHILLRPHLRFTFPVNRAAYDYFRKRRKLYFDVHAGTLEEMREIAIQSYLEEELPDLELEAELASRGVERSPELYPYRDDARLWREPIREFVQSYVHAFYASDQTVQDDGELQAWANELMHPPRQAELPPRKLVAGDRLHTREELVGLLAQVLFVAGPGHASQQYSANHFYRYPPAFPGSAYLPPPWKEDSLNEARFQNTLPPIRTAARQWTYNTFTNFRMRRFGSYGFHRLARLPEARQPILRLQEKLREVESEIARRNQARLYRYDFLLPSQVPNSIHI